MATITCDVSQVDGLPPDVAYFRFDISGFDTDGSTLLLQGSKTAKIVDGSIEAGFQIWQNSAGLRATNYMVTALQYSRGGTLDEQPVGQIQLDGSAETYALAELLSASPVIEPAQMVTVLTKAEFQALSDAVLATGDDRERAEAAAEQTALDAAAAELSASRVDLGALDAAVTQTGEDRTSSSLWAGTAAAYAGTAQLSATRAIDAANALTNITARYEVPRIADAVSMVVGPDGTVLEVETEFVQLGSILRPHLYVVPQIAGAVTLIVAPDGTVIGGQGAGGAPLGTFAAEDTVAEIGSVEVRGSAGAVTSRAVDQLWLRRSPAVFVPVTGGPDPVKLISADVSAGAAMVRRNGVHQNVKWRSAPLSDGQTMHLYLVMAQSLGLGHVDAGQAERIPYWRDHVAERAWQFQAGDGIQRGPRVAQYFPTAGNKAVVLDSAQIARLEPLRGARHADNQQYAQTSCETAALALLGQHLDRNDHFLGAVVGTGSTAIADFAPGSQHYINACSVITAAAAQAAARSLALKVWLVWNQGEEDSDIGTPQATYEAVWRSIRNGISAFAVSAGATFGGTVIQQTLQRIGGATMTATLAHAALIAAGEARGIPPIAMAAVPYSGSTHILPLTYLPLGAATGYEIANIMAGGGVTPHVAAGGAVLTTGTQIDCTITGGTGTFQFDTTLPQDTTYGVRVDNSGGPVLISSVAFTGANTLRITLGSPILIGTAPVVSFGLYGAGANNSRVSIRDNSNWYCPCTGNVVSGWMMHHKVSCT